LAVAMSSVCPFLRGSGAPYPGFGCCESGFVPTIALKPPLPPLLKGGTTRNGIRMNALARQMSGGQSPVINTY
jgi:hypothetical protein